MSKFYLALLPTPGGDKYHLFTIDSDKAVVTNDRGPTEGIDFESAGDIVSFKMPAGMTTHTFKLDIAAMTVENGVFDNDSGKQLQTQTVSIQETESDDLPENPPALEGQGGPGGPGSPQ